MPVLFPAGYCSLFNVSKKWGEGGGREGVIAF